MRLHKFGLLVCFCLFIYTFNAGAQDTLLSAQDDEYSFNSYKNHHIYMEKYNDIEKIDFQNFTFFIRNKNFNLKNGKYLSPDPLSGLSEIALSSVNQFYDDSSSSIIIILDFRLSYNDPGSSEKGIVQIFSLKQKELKSLHSIKYNPQKIIFDKQTKRLHLSSYKRLFEDPTCCPSKIDNAIYCLHGGKLILLSVKRSDNK